MVSKFARGKKKSDIATHLQWDYSQSVHVSCSFHSVCSHFGSPSPSGLPPSPACLALLNSALWHSAKAFGRAALLGRTDWPRRSPAARTHGRAAWRSLRMTCVVAEPPVLMGAHTPALLCLSCFSQSYLTFSAASAQHKHVISVLGWEKSPRSLFPAIYFLIRLST